MRSENSFYTGKIVKTSRSMASSLISTVSRQSLLISRQRMQWNTNSLTLVVLLLCLHNIYSYIFTAKVGTTKVFLKHILKLDRNEQLISIKSFDLIRKIISRKNQCAIFAQSIDCFDSVDNRCAEKYLEAIDNTIHDLSSGFARFRLLQRYLAGDIQYDEIQISLAFILGFRISVKASITSSPTAEYHSVEKWFEQDQKLSPIGWENLSVVPRLEELASIALQSRLERDLPADAVSTDTIMETLIGGAQYTYMRNSGDDAVLRRILIAKWMCVQGFLTNDFPTTQRYIPSHIQEELERERED